MRAHRGKGFSNITEPAFLNSANYVSVLSRSGMCFTTPAQIVAAEIGASFNGTLIKWRMKIDH